MLTHYYRIFFFTSNKVYIDQSHICIKLSDNSKCGVELEVCLTWSATGVWF